jgi:hypothetical protein
MPWTFAHPAAVLPLRRIGRIELPLSGLVVGSIVPDFGYYFGPYDTAVFAHTLGGLPLFCLPVALLFVFLLTRFRTLLVAPLPQPHRSALESLPSPDFGSSTAILLMVASILIGATTHIAWDSFTHNSGAAVQWIAFLKQHIGTVNVRTFYVYNLIQHASTLLGFSVLLAAYRNWIHRLPGLPLHSSANKVRDYWPLAACVLASFALGLIATLFRLSDRAPISVICVRTVMYATAVFCIAYIVLAVHAKRKNAN